MKNKKLFLFLFLWALVFIINFLTPFHSDDFGYAQFTFKFDTFYKQYVTWSGRLVADFFSTMLLSITWLWLKALINAFGFVSLAFVISKTTTKNQKTISLTFLFTFMLYWVGHPVLGQTTFWIVGAANYLWTTLFAAIYLYFVVGQSSFYNKKNSPFLLIPFSIIAGISNENTAVTLAFFTFCLMSLEKFYFKKSIGKLLICFLPLLIGCGILILAPGNAVRASADNFVEWQTWSLVDKVWYQLSVRMVTAQARYIYVYVIFAAVFIYAKYRGIRVDKNTTILSSLFFLSSLICNLVMIAAPTMPSRSMTGGFLFFVLSLLTYMNGIRFFEEIKGRFERTLWIFLGLVFTVSYVLIFKAYLGTYFQEQERQATVKKAKEEGQTELILKDFCFSTLLSKRHQFDRYYNTDVMAKYYGVEKVLIIDCEK